MVDFRLGAIFLCSRSPLNSTSPSSSLLVPAFTTLQMDILNGRFGGIAPFKMWKHPVHSVSQRERENERLFPLHNFHVHICVCTFLHVSMLPVSEYISTYNYTHQHQRPPVKVYEQDHILVRTIYCINVCTHDVPYACSPRLINVPCSQIFCECAPHFILPCALPTAFCVCVWDCVYMRVYRSQWKRERTHSGVLCVRIGKGDEGDSMQCRVVFISFNTGWISAQF